MVRRSKEDAEKTRARILQEAAKLFESRGYAETSIAEICEAAEITKGALFHYFPSKEELFREIWTSLQVAMDSDARLSAGAVARSEHGREDPYAAFLAGTRTYFEWLARSDYRQIVLVDGPAVLGTAGWYEDDHELGIANVTSGLRYLSRQGILAEERIEPMAVLLHNALNGAGFALARSEPGLTADALFEAFEALLRSAR